SSRSAAPALSSGLPTLFTAFASLSDARCPVSLLRRRLATIETSTSSMDCPRIAVRLAAPSGVRKTTAQPGWSWRSRGSVGVSVHAVYPGLLESLDTPFQQVTAKRGESGKSVNARGDDSKACEVQASVGSNPTVTAYSEPLTCGNVGRRL